MSPEFHPEIETWVARPDGKWDVTTTVAGIEQTRWVDEGRLPVDLFREAQEELRKKALKSLGRRK